MRMRCTDCTAEFEAADEAAMAEVVLEHSKMHELEDPPPPSLMFVLLPAEEFCIVVEMKGAR